MTQIFQTTEGIILQVIPFRDNDQILTLFTPQEGLIKLFYRRSQKGQKLQGLPTPLQKVEVVYRETKGELFQGHDIALIEPFTSLLKNFRQLQASCDLLQAIHFSQLIGKAAPRLYDLLCFYLKKIPLIPCPETLVASFRLKLLWHDGLMCFPLICSTCGEPLISAAYLHEAETWCERHRQIDHPIWRQKELELLYRLIFCQNYRELHLEELNQELQIQVFHFFEACIRK